jgi:polyphosphate glucokinase
LQDFLFFVISTIIKVDIMKFRKILGIDFGGSGIKGAPVDTKSGKLLSKRFRLPTPMPATPDSVCKTIKEIVRNFKWEGPVGLAFPSAVQNGIIKTAANIDKSWIGVNAEKLIFDKIGLPVVVLNDADAAGLAEMKFGAGKGYKGVVLLVTIGTGIGSVLFSRGKLVPNTELGHIYLSTGMDAELFTSDAVREKENLSWDEWARRFNIYLLEMQRLFWPELIIVGGGVSKKKELFIDHLTVSTKVVMAKAKNEAGMIGAALAARAAKKLFN